ncbi:MAG: long-chain fatty acid--CoA ligase [Candidatus Freyarchaeota archaeon]|nr:long-chain fatty acid--CoA ligase [Candidatus Jordarchaeia archaeon]MBS7267315.1 long-chain fatty acid--CoA ligase [Candidatus Jordarchaeia archaeon]MBS7278253.1 long-chain fatty acid--CoA ligase [Candidatus Jordarchaeia archaeon]
MFRFKKSKLPDYVKKKIWLKSYPPDFPKKIKIPKKSLPEVFREAAEKYGDEVSLIFYGKEYTRKQIIDWSDRLATALHNMGVRKGDVVAIYLPNSVQFLVAYYGTLAAGATVTAISPLFVPREVAFQLKDSGAETIITMDLFYENVKQIKDETPLKNIIVCNIMGEKLRVEKEDPEKIINFHELIEKTPPNPPKIKINPTEDVAVLQYTGGTTGLPKGAMLTHYNILANALQVVPITETLNKRLGIDRTIAISVLPWYHSYGQTVEIVAGALLNNLGICFSQFDPAPILEAIQKYRPNTFIAVPAILILLLNHPKSREVDFTCLKYFNMGAAPTPVELAKQWKQLSGNPLSEGYGLTEASPVTHSRCAQLFGEILGSVGPPILNTLAGIVDPDTNEFLPIGQLGELVVSGPQVMKGYWKRPEETKKVFFKAGGVTWLKTGDLARMDENGHFYILDRTKDIIKYKGHSVYPRELEEVLFTHEAIMDVAVIGVPDPDVGEQIKAYVVLKPEYKGKVTEDDILYWCKEHMAAFKYPRYVQIVEYLPKSMVGKTLRRVLREQETQRMAQA